MIRVQAEPFADAVTWAAHAYSRVKSDAQFTGIQIAWEGALLRVAACDRYRLAVAYLPATVFGTGSLLVPGPDMVEAVKTFPKPLRGEAPVELTITPSSQVMAINAVAPATGDTGQALLAPMERQEWMDPERWFADEDPLPPRAVLLFDAGLMAGTMRAANSVAPKGQPVRMWQVTGQPHVQVRVPSRHDGLLFKAALMPKKEVEA